MYGVCNYCGHKEETRDAYCPKCHAAWHIFPAQPKDTEAWTEKRGWLSRMKRSLPPWLVTQFVISIISSFALIPLDIYACIKEVYISQFSGIFMWAIIALFDLFMTWIIFSNLKLSVRKFSFSRFIISFNLGGTVIAYIHNWTQVIGHHIYGPAGLYLTLRLFILMYISYIIWLDRMERAVMRHGSPSS